jgi:RHS repeat-associated protein
LGGVTTSAPFTITVDAQYNIAPTVTIPATLPATYAPGANIVLRAAASDKDGTVTQVDFYANDGTNNVLVGSDTVAGWAFKWMGVAAGTYQITAVATDNLGGTTTSAPFTITVDAQYNIAPTVVIPTTLPTGYAPGSNIVLRASASDKDGAVSQVDFYANDGTNNVLVGSDTVAGWAIAWQNVAAGTYQITAVATDNLGGTTTSAPFTITVDAQYNIAPTVVIQTTLPTGYAPGANIVLRASASDKDGTVTQVDFYANDGTNNVLVGSDTVAGWAIAWKGVAAGTYQITAVATDNLGGTTTSAPFTITVDAQYNIAPTVVIPTTLPTGYAPGSNIILRASASDKDGTVTQVDFYANDGTNNVLVGSDTVAGWAFKWMNVAAGTYQITAVATDNLGATSTSAPYTITVGTPEAQVYYIHTDHLDTPREITDVNGNTVWLWDNSDPFGNNAANENPNGAGQFSFPLRFPGQYADKETNTNYNVNRDYDPAIGRYIESDPIGLDGDSLSTYIYVLNNAIGMSDPLGLKVYWQGHKKPNQTVVNMIEEIDECNGDKDVYITSSIRSEKANKAAGGSSKSRHLTGSAADIYVPGQSSEETAAQAVYAGAMGVGTYDKDHGGHTHIDDRSQEWNGHNSKTMKNRPGWRTQMSNCGCSK